jgi:hypothetical protein
MLLRLPLELLFRVADYLQSSSAIFALTGLNRYSKAVFIPILLRFNVSHQESSALISASQQNIPQLVASLLSDHSGNVDTSDARFRTPIYHAIRASHGEVVKLLLGHGADIDWLRISKDILYVILLSCGSRRTDSGALDEDLEYPSIIHESINFCFGINTVHLTVYTVPSW